MLARGECKQIGGKLVAITLEFAAGRVVSAHIDGDFFVEPVAGSVAGAQVDALLRDIESALVAGHSVEAAIARHPLVTLVGTDAPSIETAFRRALKKAAASAGVSCEAAFGVSAGVLPGVSCEAASGVADRRATDRMPSDSLASDRLWARLFDELEVVRDVPRSPSEQMELDERWAREVAAGDRPATLRFWRWSAPCVVVGRFQSVRDEVHERAARAEGFAVVRRCTGGGAMFVRPDDTITYSLYAPLWFVNGMGVEESYRHADQWLVDALTGLGLDAGFSGLNDIA